MAHTVLALDLGSSLGWAFAKNGVIGQSGVERFVVPGAHPGNRFTRFYNWLQQHWTGVTEIYFEDVMRFESGDAAKSYCGYRAILLHFMEVHDIHCRMLKPNTVKKDFTGKGNCGKAEMCATAHSLGWLNGHKGTDIDHDEADAIAVAWVILKRAGAEPVMYKREIAESILPQG